LLLLAECQSSRAEEDLRAADQVLWAIETLREAPSDAKEGPVELLRALPCGPEAACALQRTCLEGYDEHVRAMAVLAMGKEQLAGGTEESARKAAGALRDAQQRLERARDGTRRCVEQEDALRRHLKAW
jgi:hypothetical protein